MSDEGKLIRFNKRLTIVEVVLDWRFTSLHHLSNEKMSEIMYCLKLL